MSNVEITALETIRKEIQKLRDKYQTKAEKEREKVNEIFVTIKGEKCYSNDDIFGWYEAGYINSRQYDKYRDKLEAKKNGHFFQHTVGLLLVVIDRKGQCVAQEAEINTGIILF